VRKSAELCFSCELLQKLAEQAEPDVSIREDAIVTLRIESEALSNSGHGKFSIILANKQCVKTKRLEVYSHGRGSYFKNYFQFAKRRSCVEPTGWYNIPIAPPETIRRSIIDSLKHAASWVVECSKNHQFCISRCFANLPNRVLHVQGDIKNPRVRLCVVNGEKGPYVALSHRWGENAPPWRTTTKNIDEHLQEIPLAKLSRVFWQAIQYTLLVGGKYLWIDSLCIIQDDESDWEQEASNMASVYANAYITIAATGCNDLFSGIITKQHYVHQLRVEDEDSGQAGPIIFAEEPIEHITKRPERQDDQFPLLKRGWVYQERLLSRRVLHFGQDELFYECLESMKCECTYLDASTNMKNVFHPRFELNVKGKHISALAVGNIAEFVASNYSQAQDLTAAVSGVDNQSHVLEARWREITTEYSGLALTFPNDRLTALSGLAKQMRRYRGSRYLAGLWEDSLFRDMLWLSLAPKRQPVWQAPSWSWASQVGAIRYTNGQVLRRPEFGIYAHFSGGSFENPGNVSSPLEGLSCELLEANCTPISGDDTGRLSSGFIKVSGYVIDGINPLSSIMTTTDDGSKWLVINEKRSSEFDLDEQFEEDDEKTAFLSQSFCLLRIGCISHEYTPYSEDFIEWSLLLQRVEDNDARFRRCGIVGVFTEKSPACHDGIWYGKVREKTIVTIV
jgi:hypothetical protein